MHCSNGATLPYHSSLIMSIFHLTEKRWPYLRVLPRQYSHRSFSFSCAKINCIYKQEIRNRCLQASVSDNSWMAPPAGLARWKQLSIVFTERSAQSKELKEWVCRTTHNDYATVAGLNTPRVLPRICEHMLRAPQHHESPAATNEVRSHSQSCLLPKICSFCAPRQARLQNSLF